MATVWIPPLMRELTGGLERVTVPGEKVRDLVDALDARYPGIKARLVEDDALRLGIVLTIDGVANRQGLRARVGVEQRSALRPGHRRRGMVTGRGGMGDKVIVVYHSVTASPCHPFTIWPAWSFPLLPRRAATPCPPSSWATRSGTRSVWAPCRARAARRTTW